MTRAGLRRCTGSSRTASGARFHAPIPGKRLPTEFEWEAAAGTQTPGGNFLESGRFHPQPARNGASQFFGDVWEWTQSAYSPYPGYRPPAGALGDDTELGAATSFFAAATIFAESTRM